MDGKLPFLKHLGELRRRILFSLGAVTLATCVSWPFSSDILKILKFPAKGSISTLAFFSPEEALLVYLRISMFSGFIIAIPFILYQAWMFINPALDHTHKRSASIFIFFCSFNFIAGCAFAYFVFLPKALWFLLGIGRGELTPLISAAKYISFVITIVSIFGLAFQMPVVFFILAKLGFVDARLLKKNFKIAFVGILIIAAILTPTTDIFNMLALATPLLLLYQISIWIIYFVKPHRDWGK